MASRLEYLDDLLKSIFGTTSVDYREITTEEKKKEKKEYITVPRVVFQDKLHSNLTCTKAFTSAYEWHYTKLFILTFRFPERGFWKDNEEKHPSFNGDIALENAVNYFLRWNIDLREYLSHKTDHERLSYMIARAITGYLIPIIFQIDGKIYDVITDDYNLAMQCVAGYFTRSLSLSTLTIRSCDVPCLIDIDYDFESRKHQLNYAIPMNAAELELPYIVRWRVDTASFFVPNTKMYKDALSTDFSDLVKGFEHYPFEENAIWKDLQHKRVEAIMNQTIQSPDFPISPIEFDTIWLEPHNFYFLTCLKEEEVYKKYGQKVNQELLLEELKQKAKTALERQSKKRLPIYYKQVMMYLEEVLECIFSIELQRIIKRNTYNVKKCKEIIKAFNMDPKTIFDFYKQGYDSETDQILHIYDMIENAICSFSDQLSEKHVKLAGQIKKYIEPDYISDHAKKIKSFSDSKQMKDAIRWLELEASHNPNAFSPIEITDENVQSIISRPLFKRLKNTLDDYCALLEVEDEEEK